MYRIAICRKGQNPQRTTGDLDAIKNAVYSTLQAKNATITDADRPHIDRLIDNARAMADDDGFAALEFGGAAITIRTGPAPTPTFPGGGF